MTSRRLIRIKVLQLLYAYGKREGVTIAEVERELMKSISKSTDLYYETLLLLTEIQRRAFLKIDAARNKRLASNIDLNPNTRFIDNPVLKTIWNNHKFQSYINNNTVSWNDSQETVLYFYNKLIETKAYQKYMHQKDVGFEDHKQMVINLFAEIIIFRRHVLSNSGREKPVLERRFRTRSHLVHKTLKNIQAEQTEEDIILYPVFKPEEDTEYARYADAQIIARKRRKHQADR